MLKSHLLVSNLNFKRGQFQKATVLEDKVTLYHKLQVCLHIVRLSCRMFVIDYWVCERCSIAAVFDTSRCWICEIYNVLGQYRTDRQ